MSEFKKILVIGAGVPGLAACYWLRKSKNRALRFGDRCRWSTLINQAYGL